MSKKRKKKPRKPQYKQKKNTTGKKLRRGRDINLVVSEFEITFDPLKDDKVNKIPSEIENQVEELYYMVGERPREAIPRLEDLRKEYPNVPQLYNYLGIAYSAIHDNDKTDAITQENYERHPDYLFAKINYAEVCLHKGKTDLIPDIFENKFDLKMLYPHRDVFHIMEVTGFYGVLGLYFAAVGKPEVAISYYNLLRGIAPHHPFTKKLWRKLFISSFNKGLNKIIDGS